MNKKLVLVKAREELTQIEQEKLLNGLSKIKGFDFSIDIQSRLIV